MGYEELKKNVERIRDIQREIEADEARVGYHASFEVDDETLRQAAVKARAEELLRRFLEQHKHRKPTRMLWADYIKQIAQQNRDREIAYKKAKYQNHKNKQ